MEAADLIQLGLGVQALGRAWASRSDELVVDVLLAAEAELARRSRVMAGLDEVDGAPLEASIVEAMQRLRSGDGLVAEPAQPDGEEG